VFSRDPNQLRVFQWHSGHYQAVTLRDDLVWLSQLQLGIGLWFGNYQGLERQLSKTIDEKT
jgi:Uma2 family endonuclease